jgi:hypothetical protein
LPRAQEKADRSRPSRRPQTGPGNGFVARHLGDHVVGWPGLGQTATGFDMAPQGRLGPVKGFLDGRGPAFTSRHTNNFGTVTIVTAPVHHCNISTHENYNPLFDHDGHTASQPSKSEARQCRDRIAAMTALMNRSRL